MKVVQEAMDIIHRKNVQKAQEVEAARATYRALLNAGDDPKSGDGDKLVGVLTTLELALGDATADAKAIAAHRKIEQEIAAKDAEAAKLAGEAEALKSVIADIVRNNRDPRRANDTIDRQRELQGATDGSASEARQLRDKMRIIEQSAPRIYGGVVNYGTAIR